MSGVIWALVIMKGSAGAASGDPGLRHDGGRCLPDVYSGEASAAVVCTGHLYGGVRDLCRTGEWKLVVPSLALGLLFGYAMKNSGLWLAARREKTQNITAVSE
jgi:hypothetical protein